MKRCISSSMSFSSKISALPCAERKLLNKTTVGLYRILSRIIKSETKKNDYILLQPPLNHRDYGEAQMLDSKDVLIWRDMKNLKKNNTDAMEKILSFCKTWTQKEDQVEDKEVGNFDDLFGMSQGDDENREEKSTDLVLVPQLSIYVPCIDLKQALRQGFHSCINIDKELSKKEVLDMQRFAIDAIKLLENQIRMWKRTSISIDEEKGIRVIATSRCIGVNPAGQKTGSDVVKNWFAYRIRIDNFNEPESDESQSVQLLGRTWKIVESDNEDSDGKEFNVHAPRNGVVGYLPVIKPGQTFEYMSGCGLSTSTGTMSGCLHMAMVDEKTKSAQVGDPISAFDLPEEMRFEMKVQTLILQQ